MAQSKQEFTQMFVPEFKLTQVADINLEKLTTITNSSSGVEVLSQFIAQKGLTEQINVNEFVFILYLNKRNKVIAVTNLAIGGIDMTVMDVRLVFGLGLKCGASAIIVAHNHPTGNLQPSEADRQIARRIKEVGVLLQINALDFLIITSNNGYYSFADNSEYAHGGIMADGGRVKGGSHFKIGDVVELKTIPENLPYEIRKGIIDNKWEIIRVSKSGRSMYSDIMEDVFGYDIELLDKKFKYKMFVYPEDVMMQNAHGGIMAKGGDLFGDMEGVDLFEDYEDQPQEVQRILSKYEMEDFNYDVLQNLKAELEAIGYTMDFGLDAEPYDLRKIGQVGKSEFMAKGGITEHGLRVGDTIVSEIDANTIVVDNAVSGRRTINISTGQSMAKGGYIVSEKDEEGYVYILDSNGIKVADSQIPTNIGYGKVKNKFTFKKAKYDTEMGKSEAMQIVSRMNDNYAKGGRMGFKALSEKVASHYAGKSVPAKFQSEYGKFYDADEAKTVGNKVAAKVYRLQQGK